MSKLHYALAGSAVIITLFDGAKWSDENKEILDTVKFDSADIPAELDDGGTLKSLASYGLLKLLQDRTSQEKTVGDKLAAMQTYFNDFFKNGLWKRPAEKREGSGGSRRKIPASLAEAIARIKGCTALEAEASLKLVDKATFDGVVANEKVAAMVAELEAEAGEAVDLSDL